MSVMTLADILETKSLKNSKILAGESQLDRLVTGVTVGEVPDIANWLTGGELVLSTFFAVSRDPKAVGDFAERIIAGPAAALAIKPARFLDALPEEVIRLAEEKSFPIIEVPADTRWTSIIADFYTAMSEMQLYADFLDDLISSRIPLDQVGARLARFGGSFEGGYAILRCAIEPASLLHRCQHEAVRILGGYSDGSLVMRHKGELVIILSLQADPKASKRNKNFSVMGEKLISTASMFGASMTCGVSRGHGDPAELLRALDEARAALESGKRLYGKGTTTDFDALGIYRLLLPLAHEGREEGLLYYEETAGKLAEYDKRHGSELVATLEAFRRNDENVALAAEELFAHRHTVRYRLQRIREITNLDPFKSIERERLYMGLHLKHLLSL